MPGWSAGSLVIASPYAVPARSLEGHPVGHADRLPAGIDVAVGDLDDAESLTEAARGVDGIFYMQLEPSSDQDQKLIDAARAVGVRKIVLLSSMGTVLHPCR